MSLDNLVGISLERVKPDHQAIGKLLASARRSLLDARITTLSDEARFDLSYMGILKLANVALQLHGFRTLTSRPGHHMTILQVLPQTLGLEQSKVRVLDTLRKQRQAIDYSGDLVSPESVREATRQADHLLQLMRIQLSGNSPELLVHIMTE
jgi:hypothetical protein